MSEEQSRRKAARELLELHKTSAKVLQPGLWYAATILDPSLNEGDGMKRLVTFAVTVELGSSLDATKNAIETALEETGARLPVNEWVPDKDTIQAAYEADEMQVICLNPWE